MRTDIIGLKAIAIVAGKFHRSTVQRIIGSGINATAVLTSGACVPLKSIILE